MRHLYQEDERHLEKCRLELYNYQESSSSEELDAKYLNEMVALYEDITTGDEYENFHLARELDENLGLPLLPRLCVKIALICYHDNRPEDSERVDLAVRELRKLQALLANSGIDPQWINKINAWASLGESIAKEIKRKRS